MFSFASDFKKDKFNRLDFLGYSLLVGLIFLIPIKIADDLIDEGKYFWPFLIYMAYWYAAGVLLEKRARDIATGFSAYLTLDRWLNFGLVWFILFFLGIHFEQTALLMSSVFVFVVLFVLSFYLLLTPGQETSSYNKEQRELKKQKRQLQKEKERLLEKQKIKDLEREVEELKADQ